MRIGDDLSVPTSHPSLPGHFPGDAIVPGVVMLSLVLERLHERFGPFTSTGLRSVKFLRPLRPGELFSLDAESSAPGTLRFACRRGETLLAEGSVQVASEPRKT
jgi:3-hydroxymyristoyl/3-hydroxydecanoyl-(acyl carrier protein) dehydratase